MTFDVRSYDDPDAADKAAAFAMNCTLYSDFVSSAGWSADLDVVPWSVACEISACDTPEVSRAYDVARSFGSSMSKEVFAAVFEAVGRDPAVLRAMVEELVDVGAVTSSDTRPEWAMRLAVDPSAVLAASIASDAVAYASGNVSHEWTSNVSSMIAEMLPYEAPRLEVVPVEVVDVTPRFV